MTSDTFPLRMSHLLRHCSVGAIVRGPDRLLVVQDTRKWYPDGPSQAAEIRYVERIRSTLGIESRLCIPPCATVDHNGELTEGHWIPGVRFPRWTRCTRCGFLHYQPWATRDSAVTIECGRVTGQRCPGVLEQVSWVIVHEEGYLADVPWHEIAHSNLSSKQTRDCKRHWKRPYLHLVDGKSGLQVRCNDCGASNARPTRFHYPPSAWQQPWIPSQPPERSERPPAWILQVNDVRVHTAVTSIALIIPPESRIRTGTVVDRLYSRSERQSELRRPGLAGKSARRRIAQELRCTVSEIETALTELDHGYPLYGISPKSENLLAAEFNALIEPIPDLFEDEDFYTVHRTNEWRALAQHASEFTVSIIRIVGRLIEVRRLKELVILRGFTRLGSDQIIPPDITNEAGWLPSLSLRGEGIFFTLDERALETWSMQVGLQTRVERMKARWEAHPLNGLIELDEVSPRFVLLHTLAHLVIRKLESESGYGPAALKERIYCSEEADSMAGILIYVAVPDEVGSMGGLAELSEPTAFLRILVSVFESATWCSLDPVCSEHDGQGPGLLNGAACQACALVADPSCQYGNVLLDRTFVKGNEEARISPVLAFTQSEV